MFDLTPFLITRFQEPRQPSPLLLLFQVAVPDGTFLRFVDFWDPDARGTGPKKIPFNGFEFESMPLSIGEITASQDGSGGVSFPVAILDPLHQIAFYLRTHKWLHGARTKLWLTTYDALGDPSKASLVDLVVTRASLTQGPDTATIMLGTWGIYEEKILKLFYDRGKCWNAYPNRFTVGNNCTYPSNEFSAQTKQDLLIGGAYVEKERKHGWFTQQALGASAFAVHKITPGALRIASAIRDLAWLEGRRYGPAFYRNLEGDWDCHTKATIPTTRAGWMAGLFAQDMIEASPTIEEGEEPPPVPVSSWVFFGSQDNGAGSRRLLLRKTEADVTTDSTVASTDLYLRLARAGSVFSCYSKAAAGDAWTLRGTMTLALPDPSRIGLLIGSDVLTETPLVAEFDYIRFTAGGLGPCGKLWPDCEARKNTIQFNGWRETPNDRIGF